MRSLRTALSLCLLAFSLAPLQALAWGETGHSLIASTGASLTSQGQDFFQANVANFGHLTTIPDVLWKSTNAKEEGPNHWFQADYYFPSCSASDIATFPKSYAQAVTQYGQSVVTAQGTGPWRVRQLYAMAVKSLQSGDVNSAMQYMGTMSHYIGDMSQPLHDSENYDGGMTSSNGKGTGVHYFFESENISKANQSSMQTAVMTQAQALLNDSDFTSQFSGDLSDVLYNEVARALSHRDELLGNDSSYGRKGQGVSIQLALAEARMADGAATLALILDHLYTDAAVTQSYGQVSVSDPSWVTNDFSDSSAWLEPYCPIHPQTDDDCSRN